MLYIYSYYYITWIMRCPDASCYATGVRFVEELAVSVDEFNEERFSTAAYEYDRCDETCHCC